MWSVRIWGEGTAGAVDAPHGGGGGAPGDAVGGAAGPVLVLRRGLEDLPRRGAADDVEVGGGRGDRAEGTLTEEEREAVVDQLAANPTCGVLIRETGGIRKMRFAYGGRGKSGGVRIIYYFYDETMPVYILAGFAKNEKADLSAAERATLRQLVERLLSTRKGRS
jgi:hypothetical protein